MEFLNGHFFLKFKLLQLCGLCAKLLIMKKVIGVISDVHGNLPALEAMLKKFDSIGCDSIINLGDVIGYGAFSRECLDLLLSRKDIKNVLGNHERLYLRGVENVVVPFENKLIENHHKQIHSILGEGYKEIVAEFPFQIDESIFGHRITFLHYARKDNRFLKQIFEPTKEQLDEMFDYVDAEIVLFGHEHTPMSSFGNKAYVNVGSLGCNYESKAKGVLITITPEEARAEDVKAAYNKQVFFDAMEEKKIINREYYSKYFFGQKS